MLTVLDRHSDEGDVAEGWFAIRGGGLAGTGIASAVGIVTGSNSGCSSIRAGGARRRCGRGGGSAVGGAVKGDRWRQTLVVQGMMRQVASGRGVVTGVQRYRGCDAHGFWTVQTVMGMMMMVVSQGDMVRRGQAAIQGAGRLEVL